ncbi:hypothetical protein [Bradyrhizobium sp.]|uniref:hypothetical protein n=1 Tax=Bradyrhizobium sp. TaxID=376 RepID=UPI003C752367
MSAMPLTAEVNSEHQRLRDGPLRVDGAAVHARFAPDGQINKNLSSPFEKNIPLNPSGKSVLPVRPVLSRQKGRIAIVTNAGGDAVDAKAPARNGVAGRVSRERSTGAQDERRQSVRQNRVVPTPVAGAKLPVARSIQPDSISHQAGSDGDKTNSSPGRAWHKP